MLAYPPAKKEPKTNRNLKRDKLWFAHILARLDLVALCIKATDLTNEDKNDVMALRSGFQIPKLPARNENSILFSAIWDGTYALFATPTGIFK